MTGLTLSTSSIHLEVIHAQGHSGSNQKSAASVTWWATPGAPRMFRGHVRRPVAEIVSGELGLAEVRIILVMALTGEYEPSPSEWVRNQVAEYESSGGERANTLLDTGMPVIIVTTRGNRSGTIRKTPLMRVEHDGEYALVASKGGAPTHPVWYYNLTADPASVTIQDGPAPFAVAVREVSGDEKATWWARAVAAYPPYAEYQGNTDRQIPVFVATRKDG